VQWLFAGSCILLFGLLNIIFNSNSGEARGVRRWKLVGFAYSMAAVWISLVPIYLLLTVPRYSAAVGMAGRILTFAAVVVSFLSIFGWRMSRGILPVICNHRTRTRIGIASCLFGPLAAALFVWYLVASQSHFSVGIILMTWAWAVMAILGGLGYGLTEAARGQTESARS
jgi:hypothetical protein